MSSFERWRPGLLLQLQAVGALLSAYSGIKQKGFLGQMGHKIGDKTAAVILCCRHYLQRQLTLEPLGRVAVSSLPFLVATVAS